MVMMLIMMMMMMIPHATNVRTIAAPGGAAYAGLLEMETKAGGVCGMTGVAADAACGSMCGASVSPVAAKNVNRSGIELSSGERDEDNKADKF